MTPMSGPALTWRKSSFSGGGNGGCVEVAWRKSSYSGGGGGGCVEVASPQLQVAIRDSKHPIGPAIDFPRRAWTTFLRGQ